MKAFCIFIFLWFLFSGVLTQIPLISYVDEVLGIISYIYIVVNYKKLSFYEKKIFKLCFVLLLVGLIGNYAHGYQTSLFPIGLDFLQCTKVFIIFVASNHYIGSLSLQKKYSIIRPIAKLSSLYILAAFLCAVISLFTNIGMSADYRFGFYCFKFYHGNAGGFANSLYVILLFLTAYRSFFQKGTTTKLIIIMTLTSWLLTFRSRGFVFILVYILLYYIIIHKKKIIKLKFWTIAFVAAMGLFITADQIDKYFNNEEMPRAILLHYGVETMNRFVPIGSGFGTYGTDVAVKFYSNLYREYGLDTRWGFTPDDPKFALDNYWPAIMGQFGYIGIIIMLGILFYWIKQILANNKGNKCYYAYTLFIIITQTFSSIPTSTFFSPLTAVLFMFAPLLNENESKTTPVISHA